MAEKAPDAAPESDSAFKPAVRAADGTFTVQIKTLAGALIEIANCRDETTVGELKERIVASDKIARDTQKFVFARDGTKNISVYKSKADDLKSLADIGLPLLAGRFVLLQLQAAGAGEKKVAPKKIAARNAEGGGGDDDAKAQPAAGGAAAGGGDRCPCIIM